MSRLPHLMMSSLHSDSGAIGGGASEQFFRGESPQAWRQLFAWLAARDGQRDDRPRVVGGEDFVQVGGPATGGASDDTAILPLGVRLPLLWAGREVSTICGIDLVASRQLTTLVGLKWAVVEEVARVSPRSLISLVADAWDAKVGAGLLRWRVVDATVRAIVTTEYSPINDLALCRVLEGPLTACGVAPVRGLRSDTETRVEFAVELVALRPVARSAERSRGPGANRPGLVLRNSETGHASVSLSPALVRRSGNATRLTTPVVESRHVVRDREALATKLVTSVPALLEAGRVACTRWSAVRNAPCTVAQRERAERRLDEALGRKVRESIMADFSQRAPVDQTPASLYAAVAAATKGLSPRKRADTDPLLSELLSEGSGPDVGEAGAVVSSVLRRHASSL